MPLRAENGRPDGGDSRIEDLVERATGGDRRALEGLPEVPGRM